MRRSRIARAFPLLVSALSLAADASAQRARQVAAPASDVLSGVVRLPDPAASATRSRAAIAALAFAPHGNAFVAEVALPVERGGDVSLALLSTDAGLWSVSVATGAGAPRPIGEAFALRRSVGAASDLLPGVVVDRYDLAGASAGTWTFRVEAPGTRSPAPGWLIVRTAGEVELEAWVTTQRLVAGEPIGVAARILGAAGVERARVVIEGAGAAREIALADDGAHEDGAAGDGVFGALVPAEVAGAVRARVDVRARDVEGRELARGAQLAFPVLAPRVALVDGARTALVEGEAVEAGEDGEPGAQDGAPDRLAIELSALPLAPAARLHVSAEVWGRDERGSPAPACWLSRIVEPRIEQGLVRLGLELDLRWLEVERVTPPLELRAVRVQDPDTGVVLDARDRVALDVPPLLPPPSGARAVVPSMLGLPATATLGASSSAGPHARATPTLLSPALLLSHGYCSGGSIWPAADFTQPKLAFLDPNQNRSHDQFAQLLAATALAAGHSSFGVVAHSQGGAAALHLFTYYDSGLDLASGGRRIQSVATPYQGTPLASLGFFACGVNDNMTPSGSATWLAGIPTWARAEVWFRTTSNSGSACQFLTDLLLSNPEDGTVEQSRGQLPGGNGVGHVTGWCHTTGMSNPANYTDHARNQQMDAAAAR